MADRGFTVVVERCGVVTLRDEPLPQPIRDGQFDVETVFSGLSTGTDLSWVKGTNPALHRRWNPELGLFMPGSPDVGYPVDKFGYMQVGRVTESATPAVRPGDVVAMTYGHRSAYRADALTDRFVKLPQSLEPFLFGGLPTGAPRGWKRAADRRYPCRCRANLVSMPIVRAQDQPLAAVSAS